MQYLHIRPFGRLYGSIELTALRGPNSFLPPVPANFVQKPEFAHLARAQREFLISEMRELHTLCIEILQRAADSANSRSLSRESSIGNLKSNRVCSCGWPKRD